MLEMKVESVKLLVPVCELKPLSWFQIAGVRGFKFDDTWYVYKSLAGHLVTSIFPHRNTVVQPLPDCDSFDWQPPREPTALEMAKEYRRSWNILLQSAPGMIDGFNRIIAAMEREAGQ